MNKSVGEIAELIGGAVIGDSTIRIRGVNGIRQAQEGDLTFVANGRYLPYLAMTRASAVLVSSDMAVGSCDKPLIRVKDPDAAFVRIAGLFAPDESHHPRGIHPTAAIAADTRLGRDVAVGAHACIGHGSVVGDGVIIHAGVCIGDGCSIGDQTIIYANASIRERVTIGARCIIHCGAVIGSDGFGFVQVDGIHEKVPQLGTVTIGDDVEIGANSAVDRARIGETVIGRGTKIDNLVQIGHNVRIGEHCIVSGNVGIAGSAIIGNHVVIAGCASISGHLEIGDGVTIGALSGVTKSIKPGQVVSGFPATDHNREKRMRASLRALPEALREIRELRQRVSALEGQLNGKTENHS